MMNPPSGLLKSGVPFETSFATRIACTPMIELGPAMISSYRVRRGEPLTGDSSLATGLRGMRA
jgi:hypothetical protein